ncbi:MAG: neprosin family prolyl endopeptidase [Polyangiaceae bacterium]
MRNSKAPIRHRTVRRLLAGAAIAGLASMLALVLQKQAPVVARSEADKISLETESESADLSATPAAAPTSAPTPVSAATTRSNLDNEVAETERIQRYIDSLYSRDDVVSSFKTASGEAVDCIDFYAQPSVKIAIAKGHRVRLEDYKALQAKQPPLSPPSKAAFDGQPDREGRPRKCFGDSVPMMRTTVERIEAAGGLDAYLRPARKAPPPPPQNGSPIPMDVPDYMHVDVNYTSAKVGTIWGGQSIAAVYAPSVPNPTDGQPHSLSQTWTTSGSVFFPCSEGQPTGMACTSTSQANQCFQTIEVGWMVAPNSPSLWNPDTNPHLFTFTTQDGYWATGCYDTAACPTEACEFNAGGDLPGSAPPCNQYPGDLVPNPIVIATGSPFTPGMSLGLDVSIVGSTPNELQFTTVWDEFVGWVIYVNGQLMAGFEPGTWTGSFYELSNGTSPITTTPGAPLQNTKANEFMGGGEVNGGSANPFNLSSNPSVVAMGSEIGGAEGFKDAAYQRDIGVALNNGAGPGIGANDGWSYPAFSAAPFATDMNCYNLGFGLASGGPQTVSLTQQSLGYTFLEYPSSNPTTNFLSPAPGGSNWENYLYFGGLGNASGWPFSSADPGGGTFDFCCSTLQQNGVGNDSQCPNSQEMSFCP